MSPNLAQRDWPRDTKTDRTQDEYEEMTLTFCTCAVERERAVTSIRTRTPRRHLDYLDFTSASTWSILLVGFLLSTTAIPMAAARRNVVVCRMHPSA